MKVYYIARRNLSIPGVGEFTPMQYLTDAEVAEWNAQDPPLEKYVQLNLVIATHEAPRVIKKAKVRQ
jgi:hypothetical protein